MFNINGKTYGTGPNDFCKEKYRSLKSKWCCKKSLKIQIFRFFILLFKKMLKIPLNSYQRSIVAPSTSQNVENIESVKQKV